MPRSLYHMGNKMLGDVGENSFAAVGFELSARYEALNSAKDAVLAELLQTFERRRSASPFPIALSGGVSSYVLPFNALRITLVTLVGGTGDAIILTESKVTEADRGAAYPDTRQALTSDFGYQIKGSNDGLLTIELVPPPASGGTLNVYFEQDMPDMLVWNPPANSAAGTLYLPATYNDAIGQEPAEAIDDIYNGVQVEVISGPGVGEIKRIADYTGATRLATIDTNWSVSPDQTSLISMVCPVPRPLERAIRRRAAAEILSDNGEDARIHYARAKESIEAWMEIFDTLTPGHRTMRLYDMEADTYN